MASDTEIANLALSHIGIGREIAALETEASEEAAACRRFFTTARDATFRDFPWPFAREFFTLGLVEEDPNDDWGYSYRYPSDCVQIHRILSGVRHDDRQTRVSYNVGQDSDGLLIFTDEEDAKIEYTKRVTDVERYPPDFIMAFSFRLAHLVAPRLTGGDPFKVGERALQMYLFEISRAQASSVNEQQVDEDRTSEFERTRE